MHKKLALDLTDLAHKILRMSDKDDVLALKEKAYEVYEKLAVLAYVDEYINTTPQATETKQELLTKIENAEKKEVEVAKITEKNKVESNIEPIFEEVAEEIAPEVTRTSVDVDSSEKKIIEEQTDKEELEQFIEKQNEYNQFDEASFIEKQKAPTLEDELKDTVSVDVTADLFTKIQPKKSLNDHLQQSVQIGLNDRIAFVKHLFNGNQSDYNRVISQLNTFDNEKEAKKFITKNIKPDYDWSDKEEYETRLLEIIERRFA